MQIALRSEAECTTMRYSCALGIHGIRDLSSPGTLSLPLRSRSTLLQGNEVRSSLPRHIC
jgi:hypothetical protein